MNFRELPLELTFPIPIESDQQEEETQPHSFHCCAEIS